MEPILPAGVELQVFENGGMPSVEAYALDEQAGLLLRAVRTRGGDIIQSAVALLADDGREANLASRFDWVWLRVESHPPRMVDRGSVRVVDLFSGCGGMTLGVVEAGRALGLRVEPVLAADVDRVALRVFGTNFPGAILCSEPVESLLDSELGDPASAAEQRLKKELGHVDLLLAGPPCQGHSDLNNHTRRRDPKNALFLKTARFAEVIQPENLVIENVQGIVHDRARVFQRTREYLERELGYFVDTGTIRAEELGVPQFRHRVFLVASKSKQVSISEAQAAFRTEARTFMWACGDLQDVENASAFDSSSKPAPVTKRRIDYLFDHDSYNLPDSERPRCHRTKAHTYPSVYGRLYPASPAPTITTGFTVMGQGRFVHPTRRRTLTPHEAARLQLFPDSFVFGDLSLSAYKRLIGNAVPPKLTYVLALALLR